MTITPYLIPGMELCFDPDVMLVAQHCGVSYFEVVGKCKRHELVIPRQASCYILREFKNYSYPTIARIMNMNHATAIYNYRAFSNDLQVNRVRVAHLLNLIENYKKLS